MSSTTGDKSAQSYGWPVKLGEEIPDGDSFKAPAPGFDQQYTDTRYVDVTTPDGRVWRAGTPDAEGRQVDVEFDKTEPVSMTITNRTQAQWPLASSVYIFAPHLLAEGANQWDLKGQVWDLQQRVSALEELAAAEDPDEDA